MSLLIGKVQGAIRLRQTIKVAVPKLKFDDFLKMHFRENTEIMAHDPEEKCKPGDWVLIKELPSPLSIKVRHRLLKIVYENGNIFDPVTGKRVVGYDFEDDIRKSAEMFGWKPITERYPDDPAPQDTDNKKAES